MKAHEELNVLYPWRILIPEEDIKIELEGSEEEESSPEEKTESKASTPPKHKLE